MTQDKKKKRLLAGRKMHRDRQIERQRDREQDRKGRNTAQKNQYNLNKTDSYLNVFRKKQWEPSLKHIGQIHKENFALENEYPY